MKDAYTGPSFSLINRLFRVAWNIVNWVLFKPSFNCMHPWRSFLLRCFGAKIGENCHIYPLANIWAPWNLECKDNVCIANKATIYNQALVKIGTKTVISQEAYLCTGTHDYTQKGFNLISKPIEIEDYVWIAARAFILPGVKIKTRAVVGACSLVKDNLEGWTVYQGNPCQKKYTYTLV